MLKKQTTIAVVGAGAIGLEFASFYNTLGADTTVVEVMDRILPVEDAEISAFAKKAFKKQGMKLFKSMFGVFRVECISFLRSRVTVTEYQKRWSSHTDSSRLS